MTAKNTYLARRMLRSGSPDCPFAGGPLRSFAITTLLRRISGLFIQSYRCQLLIRGADRSREENLPFKADHEGWPESIPLATVEAFRSFKEIIGEVAGLEASHAPASDRK